MGKMKYSAAIFDMDGTVLDTIEDLADSINFALRENGLSERTVEQVRGFVGNGIEKLVERAVPDSTPFQVRERILKTFNDYYPEHCAVKTRPYDGILELLGKLKSEGVKLAINSNKPDYGVKELCEKYFEGLFDAAVGIKEGGKTKPSPDALYEILSVLGCEKSKAVYIGDSDVDIQTGRNASVRCISVDWGFKTRDFLLKNGAVEIASNCEELYALLTR